LATFSGQGRGKACCVLVFVSGDKAEQVAVGLGPEHFCAAAIAVQIADRKDTRAASGLLSGFCFPAIERGQGNAISTYPLS